MKHIKLLFSISLVFSFFLSSQAQSVIDSTNYFYLTYNSSNGKFKGSTKKVIKSTLINNQYFFSTDTLIVNSTKVYFKDQNLSNLYYDFGLKINDTFYFKRSPGIDTMTVDSIKYISLDDGKHYKHLFLNSQYQSNPLIWVEGLGEKNLGWIKYDLQFTELPELKSICKKGGLIYWNKNLAGLETINVTDTCDFNNLVRLLKLTKIDNSNLKIYPNPTSNILNFEGVIVGQYFIYNSVGIKVLEGAIDSQIDISRLSNDIYYILIRQGKNTYNRKFVKD